MLLVDFYTHNATTALLWLFQHCSHEVLLLLIVLGVFYVLVSLCMLLVSTISVAYSLVTLLFKAILRIALYLYLYTKIPLIVRRMTINRCLENQPETRAALTSASNLLDLGILTRDLNLPQALALNHSVVCNRSL